jgi:DNA polymerase III sliding clamp (beta) subunit (PCNA family)
MARQEKKGVFRFNKEFVDELGILEGIASKQSNINFKAHDGVISVVFFGAEVQARKSFAISEQAEFEFSAKSAEIMDLLKNFGEGVINVFENHIRILSGGTSMARQISGDLPFCEFPDFGEQEFQELPSDIFEMASFASFAVSKNNNGKPQERTSVKLKNNAVSIYALDGYRGVMIDGPASYQGEEVEYLFSPNLMDGLARLVRKYGSVKVLVADTGSKYLLKIGGIEITTRVLACSDSFRGMMDGVLEAASNNASMEVSLPTSEMVCYLDRTKLIEIGGERRKLEFSFDIKKNVVKAELRAGIGELMEMFEARYGKNVFANFSVALNPHYLLEACSRLHNTPFTAQFTSSQSPVLIREQYKDYGITHMVLPVAQQTKNEEAEDTVADFSDTREAALISELIDATPAVSKFVTPSGAETDFTEEDLH